MRRLLTSLVALVLLLTVAAPAVLATEPVAAAPTVLATEPAAADRGRVVISLDGPVTVPAAAPPLATGPAAADRGRVVISLDGPVTVPAGESLDSLVVANGTASIAGDVDHVLLVDGTATATGATIGSLMVIDGTATLDSATVVTGDVSTLDGTIAAAPGATVIQPVRDLDREMAALSLALIPLFILFMLGAALLVVVFALFLAAIAGRQVRSVESLISREPGPVLIAGIAGTLLIPVISFALMATVIGMPIGLLLLFVVMPVLAFLGWIVAAVWLGDWLLGRLRGRPDGERPYLAAVVGVVVLAVAGMVPFVTMIATLFGFGAVLLALWRVLRGGSATVVAGPSSPGPGAPGAYHEPSSLPGPGGYGAPAAYAVDAAPAGHPGGQVAYAAAWPAPTPTTGASAEKGEAPAGEGGTAATNPA